MAKPYVIVFSGYGLNCEEETLRAFELSGARGNIVHINDIIAKPSMLAKAQIVAFPGGFSYGDYLRSGAIARFSPIMEKVSEHAAKGG